MYGCLSSCNCGVKTTEFEIYNYQLGYYRCTQTPEYSQGGYSVRVIKEAAGRTLAEGDRDRTEFGNPCVLCSTYLLIIGKTYITITL